jgi:hypothetical protein
MKNYLQLNLVFLGVLLNASLLCELKAQSPGPLPDPSLKLHFDFDENFSSGRVIDVSGNGNDGWQMNPTNWITSTNGVFGSAAAQFTYVGYPPYDQYSLSAYIAVTNLNGFAVFTNGTISLWAQIDPNDDTQMRLLDNGYSPTYAGTQSSNSWMLGRDDTYILSLTVYPVGSSEYAVATWPFDVAGTGGTTNFHLYSVTIDCPNNSAIAYYDGQPYVTNTIGLPWIRVYGCTSQPWLCVGAMSHNGVPQWGPGNNANAGYFIGKMDDLRIYNRTLSAAEVQGLYQGSTYAQNLGIKKAAPQSVQVRWDANSNAVYQVEYRSNLTGTAWSPLQSAIPGSVTNSIIDSILGQPSRFYRVRVLP